MMLLTIFQLAFRSLASNKLRSALAMLGIIIAVWSVISALALGAGAQQSVLSRLSSLGTNLLVVRPNFRRTAGVAGTAQQRLSLEDAKALLAIEGVTHIAPVVRGSVQVKYFNRNSQTTVLGTAPTFFAIRNFSLSAGRGLTDSDIDAALRVAVIGSTVAENLFGSAEPWVVGEAIAVKGVNYQVVGLLEAKGDQGWANPDDQIIIPYSTAMKQVLGVEYLNEINLRSETQNQLDAIQTQATTLLRARHRLRPDQEDDFRIQNQAEMIATATTVTTTLSLLLGGIAGISLLVGGIGIMNIMLVTVAERTREIGIRKAIGARQRDILRQFLIESVVMSGLGGSIGLLAGLLTAAAANRVQDNFTLAIQPASVVLAISFSLLVGVIFGYYPARRAAQLDPIEALRYE